jgi:hypothetical protein
MEQLKLKKEKKIYLEIKKEINRNKNFLLYPLEKN